MMLNSIKSMGKKVAKLRRVARERLYEDKILYTNDTDPKKWWDNIKMLFALLLM